MSINLLPWRIALFQQKRKQFLIFLSIAFIISLLLSVMLNQWIGSEKLIIIEQKVQLQKQEKDYAQLAQKLVALRAKYQPKEIGQGASYSQVIGLMQWLSNLPFEEGELSELSLSSQHLHLKGRSKNQKEFDDIKNFIQQAEIFSQQELVNLQFNHSAFWFEFSLQLREKND
ncbi:hypothetical protein ACLSZ5_05150 [Avibacterium avium]|uniref:hypothetical protein n=1 Tax=Avibacterium avium TaxID=751 RepID=UPI003BF8E0AF